MDLWPDLAEWLGPTPNQGPAMMQQRGAVVHIAAGYYLGTIHWQLNDAVDVSSSFVVAGPRDKPYGVPDGKIAQLVPTDVAAWTQRAGNGKWCSIEFSGFVGDSLSAAQIESAAQLFARGHREYGWKLQIANDPDGFGLGHHSMGSNEGSCNWHGANWGHCACPGAKIIAQKPIILARAIQIANGDIDMTPIQEYTLHLINYRTNALAQQIDPIRIPAFVASDGTKFPATTEANVQAQQILKAIAAGGLTPTELAAVGAAARAGAASATVSVDVPAIVKGVNDDVAARMAPSAS